MCDYCNASYHYAKEFNVKPCGNGDLGVRAQMHLDVVDPGIILYKDKHLASGYIPISYCPICGRKIR